MNQADLQALYDDACYHTRAQSKLRDQFYDASTVRLKLAKLKNLAESAKSPTAADLESQWAAARLVEAKAKLVWLEAKLVASAKHLAHLSAMPTTPEEQHLRTNSLLQLKWCRENLDLPEIAKAAAKLDKLLVEE